MNNVPLGPVVGPIARTLESASAWWQSIFKKSLDNYIELEMVDSDTSLVASDSSMVSVLKVSGVLNVVGGDEFTTFMNDVASVLSSPLREQGVTLEVFFYREPSRSVKLLEEAVAPSAHSARAIGFQAEDILQSRVDYLTKFISDEELYIGIWTSPDALPSSEVKGEKKRTAEAAGALPSVPRYKQELTLTMPSLRERHEATVATILGGLEDSGFVANLMQVRDVLRVIRRQIDPDWTDESWQPALPGDPIPVMVTPKTTNKIPFTDLLYPALSTQLLTRDAYRVGRLVELGDYLYAPLVVEIPQRTVYPFSKLFSKLREANIPYRINFHIEGGGLHYTKVKKIAASLLVWAKGHNGKIKDTINELEAIEDESSVCRYHICVTTWAPTNDMPLLQSRRNRLLQLMQSWGDCEVRETVGDPLEAYFEGIPFVRRKAISNAGLAPLEDIVPMLPLLRPASPWASGSVLYRSGDGKLLPFEIGSRLQQTWAYLLVAMPGSGKSVMLANLIFGGLLEAGLMRMPRVAFIDIGPSSKGTIQLIRDNLPPEQRHHVAHFRMSMTRDYTINIMDTQLCCRYPTPDHKQTLVSFITQLATPPEVDAPFQSMSQLVSKVIDQMYDDKADTAQGHPNPYRIGTNSKVDSRLEELGYESTEETTWWDIVDYLFLHGYYQEAQLAQRFAVPVLSEAVSAVKTPSIMDLYNFEVQDTREPLHKAFARLISDSIRDYCVLAEPTRFDIGDVRIGSIDIAEVARSGSRAADRQTALMYALAKYALTKDFRLDHSYVANMPEHCQAYHEQRIKDIHADKKWLILDEYHRTEKATALQEDVLVDIREGRKWRLGVILASQGASDFPDSLIKFTSGRFFLRAADAKDAKALQEKFGFNDSACELLATQCNGPTAQGTPFLCQLATTRGMFTQLMYLTISPIEAWSLTTTPDDAQLRDRVASVLGLREARARLGRAYPHSATQAIELVKKNHTHSINADERLDAIQVVADRILASSPIYSAAEEGSVLYEQLAQEASNSPDALTG